MAKINSINSDDPIGVNRGGLGVNNLTSYGVICGGATSTSPVQSIAVGNLNDVFTSNGPNAFPSFQPFFGTQNLTLISSQTASNSTNINFTGLTTYNNYLFLCTNVIPVTNAVNFRMLNSIDNGSTYLTSGYLSGINFSNYNAGTAPTNRNSIAELLLCNSIANTANNGSCVAITLNNVNTSARLAANGTSTWFTGTTIQMCQIGALGSANTNAIRFNMSSGNISTGFFYLFAYV